MRRRGPTCAGPSPPSDSLPTHAPRPYLRVLVEADEALYCSLYGCVEAMHHVGPPLSAEGARRAFAVALHQSHAVPAKLHYWVIEDPLVDAAVGMVGLVRDRRTTSSAEIGVLLAAGMGNRGYAGGAILAVCGWAFDARGIARLWTRHAVGHLAAERLMYRTGFARCACDAPGAPEWRWQRLAMDAPPPSPAGACFDFADGRGHR